MGSLIFLAFYGIYFDFLVVNCCRGHLFFIAVTKGVAYLGGVANSFFAILPGGSLIWVGSFIRE